MYYYYGEHDILYDEDGEEMCVVSESFVNFLKRHQSLELFHQIQQGKSYEFLETVLENLPKLKDLKFDIGDVFANDYDKLIDVIKRAYNQVRDISGNVFFENDELGKEIMLELLPDVPHTVEKRPNRKTIYFKIDKKSGKKEILSSSDPVLINIRPLVYTNSVFDHNE
jgi:hypothetical protein